MAARIEPSNDKRHNNEIRWLVEQEVRSSDLDLLFKGPGEFALYARAGHLNV